MPCVAKKHEATSEQKIGRKSVKEVDLVLSTRELAHMIKEAGIDFVSLENGTFDNVMGESTGASSIFGEQVE